MLPSLRDRNFFHDSPLLCVVARETMRHGFPRTKAARCRSNQIRYNENSDVFCTN
jgi:hypothetical protein